MRVGYVRVSSDDQNVSRQLETIDVEKVFIDKTSAKDTQRQALNQMLDFVREGDTVVVHSLDRLARNLDDLRKIVNHLNEKKVKVEFIKESLVFSGDDKALSVLLLSILGAFAEFERSLIRERQAEGIALAKKRGVYRGRKRKLSFEQINELRDRVKTGESKSTIARDFNISRVTVYQYL